MSVSRILKRYPLEIGGVAVAVVCVAFSIPGMVENFQDMRAVSRRIQQDAAQQQRLAAQQEASEALAQIANERYENCLFVKVPDKNTLISIAPGIQVLDTETRLPIAQGTVVCDISGNTGIVGREGWVTDVAFTGNRKAVQEAIARSGLNLVPGQRDVGSSNRTYAK